jgi:hypothetical protein
MYFSFFLAFCIVNRSETDYSLRSSTSFSLSLVFLSMCMHTCTRRPWFKQHLSLHIWQMIRFFAHQQTKVRSNESKRLITYMYIYIYRLTVKNRKKKFIWHWFDVKIAFFVFATNWCWEILIYDKVASNVDYVYDVNRYYTTTLINDFDCDCFRLMQNILYWIYHRRFLFRR